MNGPSIDAIRRFKEQQEQKKREEDERKIKEKLNTLEHRSAQGDRKAKSELKKIRDKIDKPPQPSLPSDSQERNNSKSSSRDQSNRNNNNNNSVHLKPKSKPIITDFEELMKLATQNKNQILKKPQPPKSSSSDTLKVPKKKKPTIDLNDNHTPSRDPTFRQPKPISHQPHVERSNKISNNLTRDVHQHKQVTGRDVARPSAATKSSSNRNMPTKGLPARFNHHAPPPPPPSSRHLPPHRAHHMMPPTRRPMPSTSGYEDEYDEDDDFVVSDEEIDEYDSARAELSETLRSVFRYDKNRCDRREEELDRQYRAIGPVSTFEDLEREERRASRLAAAEDARALREEEERKRLKKLRFEQAMKDEKKKKKR